MCAKYQSNPMKALTGVDYTKYTHFQSLYHNLIVRITKGHNSASIDLLAPFYLPQVQFVMVKYKNRVKYIETYFLTE